MNRNAEGIAIVVDASGELVASDAGPVAQDAGDPRPMPAARPRAIAAVEDVADSPDPAPLYHQVKQFIIGQIESGAWTAGARVSSENEIVKDWGVSRQTANRALRELASEGYLTRIQGVGSFVAKSKRMSPALIVRSISDEIMGRGHAHRAKVLTLEEIGATDFVAWALDLAAGDPVFHSVILHFEDEVPIQVEDRYVNPAAAPDYLSEDFTKVTPNQHLMKAHPPLSEVEETIEAALPTPAIREWLDIDADEPCLIVRRRTWSGSLSVTQATLTHPGGSYRLLLHFRPGDRRS